MDPSRLRDPERWTVTLLTPPKRYPRARGLGFCGGFVVGYAEGGRGELKPLWWPDRRPEILTVEGRKHVNVGRGSGNGIPGAWLAPDGGTSGAIGWRWTGDSIAAHDLHPKQGYARTAALASGGDAFAGYGEPAVKKGERAVERALFWSRDGEMLEMPTPEGVAASASATDGEWVGGRIGLVGPRQRAAIWNVRGLERITLSEDVAEVYGVGGGEQVGVVAGEVFVTRAALWRGSAGSLVDLTPAGHATATALACQGGLQVGMCTKTATEPDGSTSMATRAALWAGSAASHVDLHALVPPAWSASVAASIEVDARRVRVAGHVTRLEAGKVAAQAAALWEADMGA